MMSHGQMMTTSQTMTMTMSHSGRCDNGKVPFCTATAAAGTDHDHNHELWADGNDDDVPGAASGTDDSSGNIRLPPGVGTDSDGDKWMCILHTSSISLIYIAKSIINKHPLILPTVGHDQAWTAGQGVDG